MHIYFHFPLVLRLLIGQHTASLYLYDHLLVWHVLGITGQPCRCRWMHFKIPLLCVFFGISNFKSTPCVRTRPQPSNWSDWDIASVAMSSVPLVLVGCTLGLPHGLQPCSGNFPLNHVAWPRYTSNVKQPAASILHHSLSPTIFLYYSHRGKICRSRAQSGKVV